MIVLGIESSCDDTSVALVRKGKEILSNVTANQDDFHRAFQGIVPEIASRKHLETLLPVLDSALSQGNCTLSDIDAVSVTSHPGLIGSLLIGTNTALGVAMSRDIPLYKVNHLSAHLYSLHFGKDVTYPLLGLIVSGGHTLLVKAESVFNIQILGSTLDDACGECFDKVAKYHEIGYPGGPIIDRLSQSGDEHAYDFPLSLMSGPKNKYNFSYSGLKTAVIHHHEKFKKKQNPTLEDKLASFQRAALIPLIKKSLKASKEFDIPRLGICGGVAANSFLRRELQKEKDIEFFAPPLKLCTDNGAMVAGLGYHFAKGKMPSTGFDLKPSSQSVRAGTTELV